MFGIFDDITNWFKEILISGILSNFLGMFEEVNTKVGEIATQVGQTPQGWNINIFNMIRTLSDTIVIPIAGMILTFVMCYELIHMFIDRNNVHEVETFLFFKWIFKTYIAVYILTHTFDIVMGVFALAQNAVNQSASIITGTLDINLAMSSLESMLSTMSWGELLGLYMESGILSLAMKAISICIFIIIYGRMIEIYLTISIAPIPFSTMANKEWGNIGTSYLKSLFALAFQGFLIMVCVAIYAVLLQTVTASGNIHSAIWGLAAYTILLVFTLMKTSTLAKGIFGH